MDSRLRGNDGWLAVKARGRTFPVAWGKHV